MPINPIRLPMQPVIDPPVQQDPPSVDLPRPISEKPIDPKEVFPAERLALLVAGINYPRISQGNADPTGRTYYKYCLNYKDYLLARKVVDRVVVFDFLNGQTRSFEKGGPADGQVNVTYGALETKNFRYVDGDFDAKPNDTKLRVKRVPNVKRWYFTSIDDLADEQSGNPDADVIAADYKKWNGGKEKSMSVSDVYGMFVVALAGTYQELHFFGHAFHDGPIIVNTNYYQSKFYDKDARIADFTNPTLGYVFDAQHLPKARASFTTEPTVCVWGCDRDDDAYTLLKKAEAKDAKKESIQAELEEVKKKVANTYAAALARTLNVPVIGALPGTGAVHEGETNDDTTTTKFSPDLMHVNLSAYQHLMRLYAKYLGTTFATTGVFKGDPTFGRGYAIYRP